MSKEIIAPNNKDEPGEKGDRRQGVKEGKTEVLDQHMMSTTDEDFLRLRDTPDISKERLQDRHYQDEDTLDT